MNLLRRVPAATAVFSGRGEDMKPQMLSISSALNLLRAPRQEGYELQDVLTLARASSARSIRELG